MVDPADAREDVQEDAREEDVESVVMDLSALSLQDIAELPGGALRAALRHVMESPAEFQDVFVAEHQESHYRP